MQTVETRTLGEGWLEVSRRILESGADEAYDGQATRELALITLRVAFPDPADELIAELADPAWLDWMRRNFTEPDDVPELGGARSYARRLRDYDGRDQIAWVIDRLRGEPETRSATITTLQPLADTSYIPCISLLDFWRVDGALELVVYAHSLDFGKKAYGNLVELARLQHEVAAAVAVPVGPLVIHTKSAHVYEPELETMRRLTAGTRASHVTRRSAVVKT
jgi:thymidylate synthase